MCGTLGDLTSRGDDWRSLPAELAERANEFRRTGTHLFMVGQKVRGCEKNGIFVLGLRRMIPSKFSGYAGYEAL